MTPVVIVPTEPEHIKAFTDKTLPFRLRAYTGLVDGVPIAIAGVGYTPEGRHLFVSFLTDEARRRPVTLHKAAKRLLAELEHHGIRDLMAHADPAQPAARRYLERLGFEARTVNGQEVFQWRTRSV